METEEGEVAYAYGLVSDKKEIKSEVANTLILDCFLNAFSCAQIGQLSFNAKANKSISSGSGEIVFASGRNSLYSKSENTLTNISKSSKASSDSRSDNLDFSQISSLCSFSSSMQKEGVTVQKEGVTGFNLSLIHI